MTDSRADRFSRNNRVSTPKQRITFHAAKYQKGDVVVTPRGEAVITAVGQDNFGAFGYRIGRHSYWWEHQIRLPKKRWFLSKAERDARRNNRIPEFKELKDKILEWGE